ARTRPRVQTSAVHIATHHIAASTLRAQWTRRGRCAARLSNMRANIEQKVFAVAIVVHGKQPRHIAHDIEELERSLETVITNPNSHNIPVSLAAKSSRQ